MKTSGIVKELIEKVITENGFILDEVTYQKEGSSYILTIVIDKPGTVTVDDCVTVTNLINPILDEKDPIKDSYILDVCSKEKGCE
jgi:ribosome maturation factor RimP